MRRAAIAVAVVLVPAAAVADPAAEPVRVAAAPGATDAVGPGHPDLAPPGMMPIARIDQPPPEATAKATSDGLVRRNQIDAASDRAFLLGTAITPGAGKLGVTWRGVIGPSVGVAAVSAGLTDRLEVGAHLVHAEDEGESVRGGHVKVQVLRQARSAIAIEANLLGTDGDEGVGLVMASMTSCIDAGCDTIASLHGGALYSTDGGDEIPLVGGISLVGGGGTFKFFGELYTAEADSERLIGGTLGMRFSGRQFAFDLGVAVAGSGGHAAAVPVAAVSLRP
jgi:hypothetical protein